MIRLALAAMAATGMSLLSPPKAAVAAEGDGLLIGRTNDSGTAPTTLIAAPADSSVSLLVYNQEAASTGYALYGWMSGTSATGAGVGASTEGTGWGVAADGGDLGGGVHGHSNATTAVARGVSGVLDSLTASGCAVAGYTNGNAMSTAVLGHIGELGNGPAVRAFHQGTGDAVLAQVDNAASSGVAMHVTTKGLGDAAHVEITNADSLGAALHAKSNGSGAAIRAEGGRAQLLLEPGPTAGAPTLGGHSVGELYMDAVGRLYQCTASGYPGTWNQVACTGANQGYFLFKAPTPASSAVRVEGKLTMQRSGRALISAGRYHVDVNASAAGGLTTSTNIIATAQNSGGGGVCVAYAQRLSSTTFRIKLNKVAAYPVYVAWMLLG